MKNKETDTDHPGLSGHYALERIQKRACRIMLGTKYDSYINALEQCQLTNLWAAMCNIINIP